MSTPFNHCSLLEKKILISNPIFVLFRSTGGFILADGDIAEMRLDSSSKDDDYREPAGAGDA